MRTLHDGKFCFSSPGVHPNPELPSGVLQISSDGDDRGIFWGLKFSIPGFYWVGKIGKYIFGWLDLAKHYYKAHHNVYCLSFLKQYFGWPYQPSSGLQITTY